MNRNFFLLLVFLLLTGCVGSDELPLPQWVANSGYKWQPPEGGVVRDSRAAITIAHAVWLSAFPEHEKQMGDESNWQLVMQATLSNGVWEVTGKSKPGEEGVGGGLFFYISQKDGRILAIVLTQ